MAIWQYNYGWDKADFRPGYAVIVGSGPSVKEPFVLPPCSLKIVQNLAYKFVEPDIWIGMDKPEFFGTDVLEKEWPKVFRGNFGNSVVNGKTAKEYAETYFIDICEQQRDAIFNQSGPGCKFVWARNTMVAAIHLGLSMGYRKLAFIGVDLQGDYADGRPMPMQTKVLLAQEFEYMRWFCREAIRRGIEIRNLAGNKSKLSQIEGVK